MRVMQIVQLGSSTFDATWQRMRDFTDARAPDAEDALWITEHPPVYTQGIAGKPEHLLRNPRNIPVIKTDRGGQITFHGPGQAVVYCLVDLRRKTYGVRELVRRIEQGVIELLAQHGVVAQGRVDAPGVYVAARKIASLGLKVRKGCTYHGVALNVDMDLSPFQDTNPCGLLGMKMTQCREHGIRASAAEIGLALAHHLNDTLDRP
jgi:lipoyl(octanoyl) transferase